jgi:hypothetical protein
MKPSEILLKIKRNPFKIFRCYGICGLYSDLHKWCDTDLLGNAIRHYGVDLNDFPLYSGDRNYPLYDKRPEDCRDSYFKWKWNPFSRYGRNRRLFLNWLIVEFQKRGA